MEKKPIISPNIARPNLKGVRFPDDIKASRQIVFARDSVLLTSLDSIKRTDYINRVLDYREAIKPVDKDTIVKNVAFNITRHPEEGLFFYETLRAYEKVNAEQFSVLFADFREKLLPHIYQMSNPGILKSIKSEKKLEEYFVPLIYPLAENLTKEKRIRYKDQAISDFAMASKQVLKGISDKAQDIDGLLKLLSGVTMAGLRLNTRDGDLFVFSFIQAGTDIYRQTQMQDSLLMAARLSNNDRIAQQVFILSNISNALKTIVDGGPKKQNMDKDKKPDGERQEIAIDTLLSSIPPRNNRERVRMFSNFFQAINGGDGIVYVMRPEDQMKEPYKFPMNILFKNSRLLRIYNEITRKSLGLKTVDMAYPFDQTIRPLIIDSDDDPIDYEEVFREVYVQGEAVTIRDNGPFLANIFTYLKTRYDDNAPGKYHEAGVRVVSDRKYSIKNGFFEVQLQIGNYTLPCLIDLDGGAIYDDEMSPVTVSGENMEEWRRNIVDRVVKEINAQKEIIVKEPGQLNEPIIEKAAVDYLMISTTPYDVDSSFKDKVGSNADEFKRELVETEFQRILHQFGTMARVKKNSFTPASRILYEYGDNGRIDVTVNLGKSKVRTYIDDNFELHYMDGKRLDLPNWSRKWWESVILSHLSEYMLEKGKVKVDVESISGNDLSTDAEAVARYLIVGSPYKRHLPMDYNFSEAHSLEVENHPMMQGLVSKIPRTPGNSFLQDYNDSHPSDDGRKWNWVLPTTDERIAQLIAEGKLEKKPVVVDTPHALDFLVVNK